MCACYKQYVLLISDQLYHVESLFSLGKGLMVPEETIPQNSRLLLQTGSIASSSQIPLLTSMINIALDSSMTCVAGYSVQLNLIGPAQC
jgi:hypothetical protein